jgi:imidazolonepropionase
MRAELVLRGARVATCAGPVTGTPAERLGTITRGAVAIADGRIAWVGPDDEADALARDAARTIDAQGCVLLPGLVDPHTHLAFAGSRVDDLARKLAGESYAAIAATGGGIASTVRATRAADDETLFTLAKARALAMRACGTTSVEVKSGYGLDVATELRLLAVGRRLAHEGVVHTTTTLLGAHAVPPEFRDDRASYLREVREAMIPAAASAGLADAVDVYCDESAFSLDESRGVFAAARGAGLAVRAHVGQFRDLGGAQLCAEFSALSADHLEEVSDEGLRALARAGTTAVLLPGAWRTLRQQAPDARRMRALGVRIAVGTDCNPGTSPTTDLGLAAALAARDAGLSLEEAVLAVTVEAARAAGLRDAGRIAVGARADLALFPGDDPRIVAYTLGGLRAALVVLGGRVVVENSAADARLW